jgi:hypothetical protein
MDGAEIQFSRAVSGYRLVVHRRNEDIKEDLRNLDIIRELKSIKYPGRLEQNGFPKLLSDYNPRGRRD